MATAPFSIMGIKPLSFFQYYTKPSEIAIMDSSKFGGSTPMRKEKKRYSWKQIIGVILFVTLILSIVYSAVSLFTAPSEGEAVVEFQRVKSDYTLMLIQCIGGVIVMFVPSFLERRWRIDIPNYAYITYFIFLYCAIYLGEIRRFYFVVPHWDTYLQRRYAGRHGVLPGEHPKRQREGSHDPEPFLHRHVLHVLCPGRWRYLGNL